MSEHKKTLKVACLATAAVMTGAAALAREKSCVVDQGSETYPVSTAYSTAAELQVGPVASALAASTTVECRHFLSGFSAVWDISTFPGGILFIMK